MKPLASLSEKCQKRGMDAPQDSIQAGNAAWLRSRNFAVTGVPTLTVKFQKRWEAKRDELLARVEAEDTLLKDAIERENREANRRVRWIGSALVALAFVLTWLLTR